MALLSVSFGLHGSSCHSVIRLMRFALCAWLSVAALLLATDAEVTGEWSGNVVTESEAGQHTEFPFVMVLEQEGESLTGTMGPQGGKPLPIHGGKIRSNHLSFAVDDESLTVNFELQLEEGHLKGTVVGKDQGQAFKGRLDFTRK
jgi:hypothetical protein